MFTEHPVGALLEREEKIVCGSKPAPVRLNQIIRGLRPLLQYISISASFVVDRVSGRGFYLVAPAVLGVIHGHVGAFQKLIEFPVSLFHYRDAEAGGNP